MLAQAGIQSFEFPWTPAFAGVTESYLNAYSVSTSGRGSRMRRTILS